MRLLEGNKKIHHGTFIDDHTFVDRDGNVYDLQKSSIDAINDLFNNKSNGDSREQDPNDNGDIEDSANETGGEGSQKAGGGESNNQQSNDNQPSNQGDADNNNDSDSSNSSDDAPQGADGEPGDGQSQGNGNQNDGNQQDGQQGQQGNGNQDSDNDDQRKIPPDPNKEYIDLRTNRHYRWNGSKFIQVGN